MNNNTMHDFVNRSALSGRAGDQIDTLPSPTWTRSRPNSLNNLETLMPWQQLALLCEAQRDQNGCGEARPYMILRGNREFLRSLRSAEMAAWEAA